MKEFLQQDQYTRKQTEQGLQNSIEKLKLEYKSLLGEQTRAQKELEDLNDQIERLNAQVEQGKQLQKDKYTLHEAVEAEKHLLEQIQKKNRLILDLKQQIENLKNNQKLSDMTQSGFGFQDVGQQYYRSINQEIFNLRSVMQAQDHSATNIQKITATLRDLQELVKQEKHICTAEFKVASSDLQGLRDDGSTFIQNLKMSQQLEIKKLAEKLKYLSSTENWIASNQLQYDSLKKAY